MSVQFLYFETASFFSITIPRKNKYQILKFFFTFSLVNKIKAVYLQCPNHITRYVIYLRIKHIFETS